MFTVLTDDLISGRHFALKYQQGYFIYSDTFTAGLITNIMPLTHLHLVLVQELIGADWLKKATENLADIHPVKSHSQAQMNAEELEIMR